MAFYRQQKWGRISVILIAIGPPLLWLASGLYRSLSPGDLRWLLLSVLLLPGFYVAAGWNLEGTGIGWSFFLTCAEMLVLLIAPQAFGESGLQQMFVQIVAAVMIAMSLVLSVLGAYGRELSNRAHTRVKPKGQARRERRSLS